jgi:chromosome segregation ATPase
MAWSVLRLPSVAGAILGGALIVLGGSELAAQEPALDPQAIENAAHDEALRLLGEALGGAVEATQTDPTIPDILAALDQNIEATRRIRELAVAEDILTDEQIQQISEEIGGIADSFQRIADVAPEVFARRWQEISTLDAIGNAIGFRIADARARLEELRVDNEAIQQELLTAELTRSDIEKRRLTQQANNAEIQSLEAAMIAWEIFAERHGEVMDRMGDQTEDLDVFFHALRENARVYRAAAQTLNLAKSLQDALADLETIGTLELMRSQLVQSWGDLMRIVDEVNDGLILQPGM